MREIIYKFLKDIGHEQRTDILVTMLKVYLAGPEGRRESPDYEKLNREDLIEQIEIKNNIIHEQVKVIQKWYKLLTKV